MSAEPHNTDLKGYLYGVSLYQNTSNQLLRADNAQKPSVSRCEGWKMSSLTWTECKTINFQDILGVAFVCATFCLAKWLGWVSGVVGEPLTDESVG